MEKKIMANTYIQIYIQFGFAVQDREALIQTTWKDELITDVPGF